MREIHGHVFHFEVEPGLPNRRAALRCRAEDATLQPLCDVVALALADNPGTLLRSLSYKHGQAWLRGGAGYTFDRTDRDWPSETVTAFCLGVETSVPEGVFRDLVLACSEEFLNAIAAPEYDELRQLVHELRQAK